MIAAGDGHRDWAVVSRDGDRVVSVGWVIELRWPDVRQRGKALVIAVNEKGSASTCSSAEMVSGVGN